MTKQDKEMLQNMKAERVKLVESRKALAAHREGLEKSRAAVELERAVVRNRQDLQKPKCAVRKAIK